MRQLRIRVREEKAGTEARAIEVVDFDGNVLGDLSHSAADVEWKMGINGFSMLVLTLASERIEVESIDLPDPFRRRVVRG